ncbi:hypothetical protein SAMN05444287_2837 [Octadecabacter temperatus]|uniref:Uncharacterized protein n=1 Tax=Octadecabacter temperatus TaxID=1458307 RepID=A0A0K0Y967_9RHOB|nr:hypothetical protein [Octadecabacter temperatus]AKS47509.1 hypothetical protein OSB_29930 [Octadecabacter temperatus]SIO41874.1 hypothetical protein SAMN05444287_2837 [Octadecabacter temperatus]
MALLGEKLTGPKFAAIVLAVYAICYAALMLIAGASAVSEPSIALIMFGLLALAATPFIALTHLNRITDGEDHPPARPIVMAIVMAAPAVFWLYWGIGSLASIHGFQAGDVLVSFLAVLMPGLLALWLSVTFAILAVRARTNTIDIE